MDEKVIEFFENPLTSLIWKGNVHFSINEPTKGPNMPKQCTSQHVKHFYKQSTAFLLSLHQRNGVSTSADSHEGSELAGRVAAGGACQIEPNGVALQGWDKEASGIQLKLGFKQPGIGCLRKLKVLFVSCCKGFCVV